MSTDNAPHTALSNFSDMPLKELEHFINALNGLVTIKRAADSDKRDKFLLRKINQTVLSEQDRVRYAFLQEKMELENLSEVEYQELLVLVDKEESIRNARFQYLLELAQLRRISLTELMTHLGLNVVHYA